MLAHANQHNGFIEPLKFLPILDILSAGLPVTVHYRDNGNKKATTMMIDSISRFVDNARKQGYAELTFSIPAKHQRIVYWQAIGYKLQA